MTYTFEQLKDDVRKEAEALRVHATSEERDRLVLNNLDVTNRNLCIYGQMTGDCFSYRSADLIHACTKKYFASDVMVSDAEDLKDVTIDSLLGYALEEEVLNFKQARTDWLSDAHYSAIEAYILLPEARNANLIAYLRGETDTLDL